MRRALPATTTRLAHSLLVFRRLFKATAHGVYTGPIVHGT
jgi:hypothetical protein